MNNIIRIINSIEESGLLTKAVRKIIKNQAKEQRGSFPSMLITILGASSLQNLLTSKGTIRADQDFNAASFKYKIFINTNLNLIVFIQERI